MIRTILRICWINLKRDRIALGLTFVLPVIFFSIFAVIFGGMGDGGGMNRIRVVAVDLDNTEASRRFLEALGSHDGGLNLTRSLDAEMAVAPTREQAIASVRGGDHPAAIVIPAGFSETFGAFSNEHATPVELFHDSANPVASQMVAGLMQKAAMTAAPDLLMERGIAQLEKFGEPLTPLQREAIDSFLPTLRNPASGEETDGTRATGSAADGTGFGGLVPVNVISVQDDSKGKAKSIVAFYAAGTGVMFLLFSMSGFGGTLLEEQENGVLDRLLSSNIGMGGLILGKWLFFTLMGAVQVTLMFLWGAAVFGIELFTARHLAGFAVMTLVTAMAAGAFGLLLASACRTRAQLGGLSTIIILIMSAIGGSMVPRFILTQNPLMETAGLFTFNGWALDGYLKVFWFETPVEDGLSTYLLNLWPQVVVLCVATVAFLGLARRLSKRWEAV